MVVMLVAYHHLNNRTSQQYMSSQHHKRHRAARTACRQRSETQQRKCCPDSSADSTEKSILRSTCDHWNCINEVRSALSDCTQMLGSLSCAASQFQRNTKERVISVWIKTKTKTTTMWWRHVLSKGASWSVHLEPTIVQRPVGNREMHRVTCEILF